MSDMQLQDTSMQIFFSSNPNLTSVPHELAKLKECDMIDLEGCPIPASVIPRKLITGTYHYHMNSDPSL